MKEVAYRVKHASSLMVALQRTLPSIPESNFVYSMYAQAFEEAFGPFLVQPTLELYQEYGKDGESFYCRKGNEYVWNKARHEARLFLTTDTFWLEHFMLRDVALKMINQDLDNFEREVSRKIDNGRSLHIFSETRWQEIFTTSQDSFDF